MAATPEFMYLDSPRDTSTLPVKTVDEVISEAGEAVPWVIENVLARGALTEFSGLAKRGGKTTWWLHGIAAGARGEEHAGFSTSPGKYLYLTEQGNNFAGALRDSGLSEYSDHIHIVQFKDIAAVQWDRLIHQAGAEANRRNLDAMVVDTFAVFARLKGTEENDSGPVADRMRVLRLVAQRYNIAVALVRHAGKDGTPRGSSAFEAEADICVTLSRPEGRHAPSVRRISGIGRYGEWESNIQLVDGRFVSLGTDRKIEFNKAVQFIKSVLPGSPEGGLKKQEILDKRTGSDGEITASTLDRALAWLVKHGDVGEKQLMDQRGKPKLYWVAYKPPGELAGVSIKPQHAQTGFGENKCSRGSEDTNIHSHQTRSYTGDSGENKSGGVEDDRRALFSGGWSTEQKRLSDKEGVVVELQHDNHSSSLAARSAPTGGRQSANGMTLVTTADDEKCIHGYVGGNGCYLHDPEHPYRKYLRGAGA